MKVVATMHARGRGSTLPNKNMYPMNGRPMIWHFLKEMTQCTFIDAICVWTDSEEIAAIAEEFGCVAIERPREMVHFGSGFHPPEEWDRHFGERIHQRLGTVGDIRVYLNCNYVLLTAATMEKMFDKLLEDEHAHMIYPIYKIDPHLYMINPNTNYLFPFWEQPGLDRQKYPQLYRKVGVAIHHPGRPRFKQPPKELFHIIPWAEGRDVQNIEDIDFAEFMLAKRYEKNR